MYYRRGRARSPYELGGQVAERRRIKKQIDALETEKKVINARIEAEKKTLQKKLDRLDHNIGRFYFGEGGKYFKEKTKTIFTAFGRVGSKAVKKLIFHKTKDEVIDAIIETGRVRDFLSVQLKEGALKKDPAFARLVGVEVVGDVQILISPPKGEDDTDDS